MYVSNIMSTEIIHVTPDARLNEMSELMYSHHLRHLPVLDEHNHMVGLVSRQDIQKAAPSPISTLSIGESKYLLSKVTAQQIMQKKVISCEEKTLVEEAGQLLRDHSISSLPVLRGEQLVGIVTIEDIMDFFLDITGCQLDKATRIAVRLSDEKGGLCSFLQEINNEGGYIATVVSPMNLDEDEKRTCIVRYYADNPHEIDNHLKKSGYEMISEDFLAEEISEAVEPPTTAKQAVFGPHQIADWMGKNDQLAKKFGMHIEEAGEGHCKLSMRVTKNMLNAVGVVHGGTTFALADVAFAIASNSHGRVALSINANINYISTAKEGDVLTATAKEISLGKNAATYRVEVRRADKNLTATFSGTVFRKNDEIITLMNA